MGDLDTSLCLREFWECLDVSQRDSLRRVSIRDDDEAVQCPACRPCYKAAVIALKEKASEARVDQDMTEDERQTIWVSKLCEFLGVYSNQTAWEGNTVVTSQVEKLSDNSVLSMGNMEDMITKLGSMTETNAVMAAPSIESNANGPARPGELISQTVAPAVDPFAKILPAHGSVGDAEFVMLQPMAKSLVEHICSLYDPSGKMSTASKGGGGAGGSGGGKRKGKKGKKGKGKKGKKGKGGGGSKESGGANGGIRSSSR